MGHHALLDEVGVAVAAVDVDACDPYEVASGVGAHYNFVVSEVGNDSIEPAVVARSSKGSDLTDSNY